MGRWESWKALRQWHRGRYVHRDGTRMQRKGRRVEEMLWQRSKARFSLVVIHNLLEMNVFTFFIPLQFLLLYLFLFQLSDCILFWPSSLLHTTLTLPSTFWFFPSLHKDTGTKTTNQSKKTKNAWSHLLICIYYPLLSTGPFLQLGIWKIKQHICSAVLWLMVHENWKRKSTTL